MIENGNRGSSNTKNRAAMWSSNPIPGDAPRQSCNSKRGVHRYVHSSTVSNSQDMRATWVSNDRSADKEGVEHTYDAVLLCHRKVWDNTTCRGLGDLEILIRGKESQKETDKHPVTSFTCGIWNRTQVNVYETEMDSHREQTCDSRGGQGWEKRGLGVMNNKALL